MEKRELIKFNVVAVILVKDGDTVLREEVSDPVSCYSLERIADVWAEAKASVDASNNSNRKTRRGADKTT